MFHPVDIADFFRIFALCFGLRDFSVFAHFPDTPWGGFAPACGVDSILSLLGLYKLALIFSGEGLSIF